MKLILSFSCLVLIFIVSALGLQNPVDYTGTYQTYASNPEILQEQMQLKSDFTFEYKIAFVKVDVHKIVIRGKYRINGKKLSLLPNDFGDQPSFDKAILSEFESGNIRLQPVYHLRQLKDQLSLCQQDVKRDLLLPRFVKIKDF